MSFGLLYEVIISHKNNDILFCTIQVELNAVASVPTCTHVRLLNAFSDLDSLKAEIQQVSCKG